MGLRDITEQHHYPGWLLRNPHWIFIHYLLLRLFFIRSRVCRKALAQLIERDAIVRVLDAGCGEGQYTIPFARQYPEKYFTGIDVLHDHIDFLNTLKQELNLDHCTFLQNDIESHLGTHPGYHLIIIIGVLQYLKNPEAVIEQAFLHQSYGGYLFIYTPVDEGLEFGFYKYFRRRYGHYDDAREYYHPIQRDALLSWVAQSGYSLIEKQEHYGMAGSLGHQIMQSILMMASHGHPVTKALSLLIFILFMPIFVPLQWADTWIGTSKRSRSNGLLLILQKL